ncbi:MAG TPA: hypothetical protein VF729_00100, partial [Solirubrobacterales bacterium]
VDGRFDSMQAHMDQRFDAMQAHFDRRSEAQDKRFERMEERMDGFQRTLIVTQATFIVGLIGLLATQI